VTVRVRRVTTTRSGGVSAPPYHSFNLGDHVGDDPAAVAANRARLASAIGLGSAPAPAPAPAAAEQKPADAAPAAAPAAPAAPAKK
jgi:hypothetical protein